MTLEAVQALTEAMPDRYRALVTLAAGTGLRQGEVFGLTVDRVDFLRRQLNVDRQLVTMPDRAPYLGRRRHRHRSGSCRSPRSSSTPSPRISRHGRADGFVFTTDLGTPIRRTASPTASGGQR